MKFYKFWTNEGFEALKLQHFLEFKFVCILQLFACFLKFQVFKKLS
jgi:hypothetical protein